jgi:hypothetical protein
MYVEAKEAKEKNDFISNKYVVKNAWSYTSTTRYVLKIRIL